MDGKENKYSEVIFGYMDTPSYGCIGKDDGGFSVAIYPDGKLIYKTYIFDEIEKTKREFKLDLKTVDRIAGVLAAYEQNIKNFDEDLDNGSCDGSGNIFIFNGKMIVTWNIDYYDEDELKKSNPEYYKAYLSVIRQENLLMEIFFRVSKILKTRGIDLRLYEVKFRKKLSELLLRNLRHR